MQENEKEWYGWKDIELDSNLIGDTINKGSGIFEKEYTYIKIPAGYGYDGYCFLLSSRCVHNTYFSICHDMKIELIFDTELREKGKKYKRYSLDGRELFNNIFESYEANFIEEYIERAKKQQEEKEKSDKKKIGRCVCGLYRGNNSLFDSDNRYMPEDSYKAFFQLKDGSRFANKKFQKIENVKVIFEICASISKYEFDRCEDIINAYLKDFQEYYDTIKKLEKKLEVKRYSRYSKSEMKYNPSVLVKTNLDDITEQIIAANKKAMNTVQERLQERLSELRRTTL